MTGSPLPRSEFARKILYLDGKPYTFKNHPYQVVPFNRTVRRKLLKYGRQAAKSTTIATDIVTSAVSTPHFRILYSSPSEKQTAVFSNLRLGKILAYSHPVRKHWINSQSIENVYLRTFSNGSEVNLMYASSDPERGRGITSDVNYYDEIQDVDYDLVVPILDQCFSNSEYQRVTYAGTPKSLDNSMEWLWENSTQCEWIMPCPSCDKWQYVVSPRHMGKRGLICVKCGHSLDARHGKWYALNPLSEEDKEEGKTRIEGYHVPQPILPRNAENPLRWAELLDKLEDPHLTEAVVYNEIFGVSYSAGERLLNKEDLLELCGEYVPIETDLQYITEGLRYVVAGVDWGGGSAPVQGSMSRQVSRTVLWIFGLTPEGQLKTVFFKIFPGAHPSKDVEEVARLCMLAGCDLIMGDAGGGNVANDILRRTLGHHKTFQVQYGSYPWILKWNKEDRYLCDKAIAVDQFMLVLKNKGVIFPHRDLMTEPIRDILAEFEQLTRVGRKLWTHNPAVPDDSLHAMIYAWLALRILMGERGVIQD